MQGQESTLTRPAEPSPARRNGYLVTIVVNVALLYVVNHLLEWEIFPFLTEDFTRLLPVVTLSLAASVGVNIVYLGYEPAWFRSLTQLGLNAISLLVLVRTYQIFPFDFTAYEFGWAGLVRIVLVVSMVGVGIASLVEVVRFLRQVVEMESRS